MQLGGGRLGKRDSRELRDQNTRQGRLAHLHQEGLKRHGCVETITTDGLRSYGAAMDELGHREKQEIGRWANNRAENSHLSLR